MSKKGSFIVFEGLDGAGTTTQTKILKQKLNAKHKLEQIIITREPSDREIGKLIRRFLKGEFAFEEETMALLFAADRLDHIHNVILPAINYGKNVISDRYFISSLAYQSVKVDSAFVEYVNKYHVKPDLTILIDIDPVISLERKKNQPQEAYEKLEMQKKVRQNYLDFANTYKKEHNVEIIDGSLPIENVSETVYSLVSEYLN